MDIKEEDILKDKINTHWYYVSKSKAMKQMLKPLKGPFKILDVGAGSGFFSKSLLEGDRFIDSVCVDPNYAVEESLNYNNKPISFVKHVDDVPQNLILMMDVLEHVDDDGALLGEYVSSLEKGGYVFITVPAFEFLWSGHDVFLEHKRRYTINSLEAVVHDAGLTVLQTRYYFGLLFPVIAVIRLLKKISLKNRLVNPQSDLQEYHPAINKALTLVHNVERKTLFNINRFFGLSVLCLCKK